MQVYAKIDESDVGKIRTGQPVTFKVDAFPKDRFHGAVSQVRMNPTTVQNVVTYDAIIDFAEPRPQAVSGDDGLRDDPGRDRRERDQGSERRAALQAAAAARPGAGALREGRDRGRVDRRFGVGGRRRGDGEGRAAQSRTESAIVWKLEDGERLEPVEIALGITDHTYTEVARSVVGTSAPATRSSRAS